MHEEGAIVIAINVADKRDHLGDEKSAEYMRKEKIWQQRSAKSISAIFVAMR